MSDSPLFWADGDNAAMQTAIRKAQETFPYFWRELYWEYRRIVPALNMAAVKIAFTQNNPESDFPTVEHMWVNDIDFDGYTVKGVLLNDPQSINHISQGDEVDVPLNQISDWLFATEQSPPKGGLLKMFSTTPHPRAYGGFTIQTLRAEMGGKARKEHDEAWGLDFGSPNEVLWVRDQKEKPENLNEHPMSRHMRESLIAFLKENPTEINNIDNKGLTMLHREAVAGNRNCIEVLLSLGADKNCTTYQGDTALNLAKKLHWEHVISALETD